MAKVTAREPSLRRGKSGFPKAQSLFSSQWPIPRNPIALRVIASSRKLPPPSPPYRGTAHPFASPFDPSNGRRRRRGQAIFPCPHRSRGVFFFNFERYIEARLASRLPLGPLLHDHT